MERTNLEFQYGDFFKPSIDRKLIIESKEASEKLVKDYDINKEKIDFLEKFFIEMKIL